MCRIEPSPPSALGEPGAAQGPGLSSAPSSTPWEAAGPSHTSWLAMLRRLMCLTPCPALLCPYLGSFPISTPLLPSGGCRPWGVPWSREAGMSAWGVHGHLCTLYLHLRDLTEKSCSLCPSSRPLPLSGCDTLHPSPALTCGQPVWSRARPTSFLPCTHTHTHMCARRAEQRSLTAGSIPAQLICTQMVSSSCKLFSHLRTDCWFRTHPGVFAG